MMFADIAAKISKARGQFLNFLLQIACATNMIMSFSSVFEQSRLKQK